MEYLYIFRSYTKNGSLLKFGYSSDIWQRLGSYKSQNPGIEIVYIAQLSNAFQLEQEFHNLHQSTYGNEWYEESLLGTMMKFINNLDHVDYTDTSKPKREYKPKYENIGEDFKQLLFEYCNLIDGKDSTYDKEYILSILPEIKDIIVQIGTSKVRSLKYNLKRINQHLYSGSNEVTNAIKARLDITIEKNKVYASSEIKTMLQGIYNNLKIDKKAKATDLTEFYSIDKKNRGINGKVQDSVIIL